MVFFLSYLSRSRKIECGKFLVSSPSVPCHAQQLATEIGGYIVVSCYTSNKVNNSCFHDSLLLSVSPKNFVSLASLFARHTRRTRSFDTEGRQREENGRGKRGRRVEVKSERWKEKKDEATNRAYEKERKRKIERERTKENEGDKRKTEREKAKEEKRNRERGR